MKRMSKILLSFLLILAVSGLTACGNTRARTNRGLDGMGNYGVDGNGMNRTGNGTNRNANGMNGYNNTTRNGGAIGDLGNGIMNGVEDIGNGIGNAAKDMVNGGNRNTTGNHNTTGNGILKHRETRATRDGLLNNNSKTNNNKTNTNTQNSTTNRTGVSGNMVQGATVNGAAR